MDKWQLYVRFLQTTNGFRSYFHCTNICYSNLVLGEYIEKGCFIGEQESVLYQNGCPETFDEGEGYMCLCEGDLCNVDKDETEEQEVEVKLALNLDYRLVHLYEEKLLLTLK